MLQSTSWARQTALKFPSITQPTSPRKESIDRNAAVVGELTLPGAFDEATSRSRGLSGRHSADATFGVDLDIHREPAEDGAKADPEPCSGSSIPTSCFAESRRRPWDLGQVRMI
jgi:hypothetical protein